MRSLILTNRIPITNQKGQSDIVFEVLVAVILLAFVLVAGTLAMSSLSNTKCSKSIDIALNQLKQNVEKASNSSLLSTEIQLDVPYCFGTDANVQIMKQSSAQICSIYCPGVSGQCYLLKYSNSKDKVSQIRYNCLQLSPTIVLNDDKYCTANNNYADYSLVSTITSNNINMKNGRYIISSGTLSVSNSSPNICVYKKDSK